MSSESQATQTDNSSFQDSKVADGAQTREVEADGDKIQTSGSTKDAATGSGSQGSGVGRSSGGSASSGNGASANTEPKPDDDEGDDEQEEEEEEEESDEDVPEFKWGNPRGRLAPPVKGQQPRPK